MEPTLNDLLTIVEKKLEGRVSKTSAPDPRLSAAPVEQYWIAVAGAPGSGKSTLCKELAAGLNARGIRTTVIPMDGFHFYRRELDQMPNSEEAHSKRGSHWTFNSTRLVQVMLLQSTVCRRILIKIKCQVLSSIREAGSGKVPSFDHAVGDPVEDDIMVPFSSH